MFLVVGLNTLRDWKHKRYWRSQMSWGMKGLQKKMGQGTMMRKILKCWFIYRKDENTTKYGNKGTCSSNFNCLLKKKQKIQQKRKNFQKGFMLNEHGWENNSWIHCKCCKNNSHVHRRLPKRLDVVVYNKIMEKVMGHDLMGDVMPLYLFDTKRIKHNQLLIDNLKFGLSSHITWQ